MANYLPVLLVSVAVNSIPDDSSVSTLPRGQVDYLSHDWEEEDVWRSWRNMTRQKNEIANGIRLENASWRTWWKRRNGLGTVTPETLNWLKDSDVTWLYGPLHTAVDWTPPPKSILDPGDTSSSLHTPNANATTHKPILKHRSISQLLISSLPISPKFISPCQSDEDIDYASYALPLVPPHLSDEKCKKRRPTISHTKSDSHIMRWGSDRDFRKDLPSQIDPLHGPRNPTPQLRPPQLDSVSSSNTSSDSGSSPVQPPPHKKRHISFNTFVEQYIAIEKPNKAIGVSHDDDDEEDEDEDEDMESCVPQGMPGRYPYGRNAWGYDDGYEEDEEEDSAEEEAASLSLWDEGYDDKIIPMSDSDFLECDEVGSKDDLVVRLPSYDAPRATKSSARSPSTISTTSSSSSASTSTSASTSSTSSYSAQPRTRSSRRSSTSTTSTCRPQVRSGTAAPSSSKHRRKKDASPLIHSPSDTANFSQPTHVTIAPIAPTILKTGTHSHYGAPGGWVEGFGDEGGSDDGLWGGAGSRWWHGEDERKTDGSATSEGTNTPVELVFVPPLGSHYMRPSRDAEEGERKGSGDFSSGTSHGSQGDIAGHQEMHAHYKKKFSIGDDAGIPSPESDPLGATVPTVVIRRPLDGGIKHDSFDIPRGINSDEEQMGNGRKGSKTLAGAPSEGFRGRISFVSGTGCPKNEERSRSRSRSRTPSPAIISPTTSGNIAVVSSAPLPASSDSGTPIDPSTDPLRARKSASISPPSSALLSPPLRGRGFRSHQDLQSQAQTRGRSSTRTASSDRERSVSQYSSSLGSLSPEGIELGGAYASGRLDKEWERERRGSDRERSRGRERTGSRRMSQSLSPESLQDSVMKVAAALVPPMVQPSKSTASSSSSSSSSTATVVPAHVGLSSDSNSDTQELVNTCPTPTNSPVTPMHSGPANGSWYQSPSSHPSKSKSSIRISAPHPAQPSTSYSISIPRIDQSAPSSPTSPRSPSSPTRPEVTIVGKAVEIVSSAGAFLGLWQHAAVGE